MKTLEKENLKSLVGLKTLSIRNTITEIQPGAFDGLSKLIYLDLSINRLERLRTGVFQGLGSLEQLDLSSSIGLSEIEPEAFIGLTNLKTLNLSNSGKLKTIDSNAFAHLHELRSLKLYKCNISSIDPCALDDSNIIEE